MQYYQGFADFIGIISILPILRIGYYYGLAAGFKTSGASGRGAWGGGRYIYTYLPSTLQNFFKRLGGTGKTGGRSRAGLNRTHFPHLKPESYTALMGDKTTKGRRGS